MSSEPAAVGLLQFGTGRFLRAFVDLFAQQARAAGQPFGSIAVVQSTGHDVADQLNRGRGRFHVIVRGLERGQVVDRVEPVESVSCAYSATRQWDELRELVRGPQLRFILSNTTEAGYTLEAGDSCLSHPPHSFPAKLVMLLLERFRAEQPGLTIIPCELIEGNADQLRSVVLGLVDAWNLPREFHRYVAEECVWLNTLVDRIVTPAPEDHPTRQADPLAVVAEPFAFWALQEHPRAHPFITHPAILRTPDVRPFFLRKVRILNAAHTALLIRAVPRGHALVREAMADAELAGWLEELLFREVLPALEGRVEGGEQFARDTLERFRNPFLNHRFADIALHHAAKVKIRLESTRDDYVARFGSPPPLLQAVLDAPPPPSSR